MKKTYINPSMEVVKVSALSMICGSLDPKNLSGSVTEQSVTSGTAGESRRGGLWDDDEE